jgi:arylformamidase
MYSSIGNAFIFALCDIVTAFSRERGTDCDVILAPGFNAISNLAIIAGSSRAEGSRSVTQPTKEAVPAAAEAQHHAVRQKGPRVFLDMDQAELDDAYNQIKYAPNQPQIIGRYASNSVAARGRLGEPRRFAYGGASIERFDLYAAPVANAPVCVFIHGGAWRQGEATNYAFPAETFVGAGAHFAALDFDNVVATGGDLMPIADQVRRAVAWIYSNAPSFGADPRRLYVCGHSSGAHLAGVVLTTDWAGDFGLPADAVRGGFLTSGMYDLEPVRLSSRSDYLRFTDAVVEALSPKRHVDRLTCPILVAHGTLETPEFQRQARDFVAAAKSAGKPAELLIAAGYNHFEILETLGNPYGLLGQAALRMMKLQH